MDMTPLHEAAQAEIADGLRACQVAVARNGEVVWTESFGEATAGNADGGGAIFSLVLPA